MLDVSLQLFDTNRGNGLPLLFERKNYFFNLIAQSVVKFPSFELKDSPHAINTYL